MSKYGSLKDYLSLNHLEFISRSIMDYINDNTGAMNYKTNNVKILTQSKIAFMPFDILTFAIGVSCEEYDADNNSVGIYYYKLLLTGNMEKHFSNLKVLAVEKCTHEKLISDTVTSQFGLPDINFDNLEEKAKELYNKLCNGIPQDKKYKYWFPVIDIKEKLKKSDNMHMWPADLPKDCLGQIRFEESFAMIYDVKKPDVSWFYPIPANTILLNVKYYRNEINYDDIITATHELIHWHLHREYIKLLQFLDDSYKVMQCSSVPINYDDNMPLKEKARWYAEWQANELAIRVAVPKHLVEEAIDEYENSINQQYYVINSSLSHDGLYYHNMIFALSSNFNVPPETMKMRFRQLGYDYADGTFVFFDNTYYPPFTFERGTLKENETFVIDRINYERLLRENKNFAELINSGKYIYLGYVVCLVDQKYIDVIIGENSLCFQLTTYASEHADECCIKFAVRSLVNTEEKHFSLGQASLSKTDKKLLQEYEAITPVELKKKIDNFVREDRQLNKTPPYGEILAYYISNYNRATPVQVKDERGNFTHEATNIIIEFAEKIELTATSIKKYLNNEQMPKLETAMRICFGLDLNETQMRDMLKKAGYNIDAPSAENTACRMMFGLSKDQAKIILNKWKVYVEYIKKMNSY